ncbi:hypothetical protein BDN72DRAFT_253049 [Pluteus cervinus]|uniref:Uncharacterized protein n=1 Tax=Pluteus cervinus TaxID=181527 RepID=A0ACD3AGY8_9AGAR|nr:hypothetical protein BDN72DRAFT_253049 [Pluteus cervinus]
MAKSDKKAVKSAKTKAPTTEKKVAAPAKAKAISSTDLLAKLAPKNGKGAPSKKAPTTKDSSDSESSDSDSDSPAIPPKTANGKNGAALKVGLTFLSMFCALECLEKREALSIVV